jgi:type VI secretion system protein ImpJ
MSTNPAGEPSSAVASGLGWGFEQLDMDDTALDAGRVVLRSAAGVFSNGKSFSHPGHSEPLVLELPPVLGAVTISLVGVDDVVGSTVPSLQLSPDVTGGQGLVVSRVRRRDEKGPWEPDKEFMPPFRRVQASRSLLQLLHEMIVHVEARCRDLAARLSNRTKFAEIADVLMLHDLNQAFVELRHLQALSDLHPERLFLALARLAAASSTYSDSRSASGLPTYNHAEPGPPFRGLARMLTNQFSAVLSSSAVALPIERRKFGIHVVVLGKASKSGYDRYVLQVLAALPAETLRSRFPSQIKIGPVDRIRDLVNLQLPGIILKPLPVAPRELPYHAGAAYFGLDEAGSDLWGSVLVAGTLAVHVAGDFPDLDMTLWHLPTRS